MKPVMQQITSPVNGDCLRACVASLLELNIEDVPNFRAAKNWFGDKDNGLYYFLLRNGYEYTGSAKPEEAIKRSDGVNQYFIGRVKSVNFEGVYHSVVFKGLQLVHDPSPVKKWQGTGFDALDYMMIEKVQL